MLLVILKKETGEIFREGRFRVLTAIITILLIVSSWVSYNHQKNLSELHEQAQLIERKVWETQKSKNPHGAAHFGQYVFKPVYPLSVIDPGVDRYAGVMQYLEAHKRNHEQFSAVQDQTELARFADLTPAFVLLYLIPLLLIVIGFNIVARERENGSLKMLLAQGVPGFMVMSGKWLATIIAVAIILLPVFAVVGFLLAQSGYFHLSTFLLFIGGYMLCYAVISGVTVCISALSKKSRTAFLGALSFWIVTTVLIPKVLANVANDRAPLLTNEQITQWVNNMNKSRGGNIHDLAGAMYQHLVDSLLKKYKVDSVSQLPVNMAGIRLDMGEQMDTKNFEVVYDSMFYQMQRQQKWLSSGAILSPFLLTQDASTHLAQTDYETHRHFSDAGENYRRVLVNRMNRFIAYESKRQESFTAFDAPDTLWKSVPEFHYTPLTAADAINASVPSLSILTIWLLVVLHGLFFTSRNLKN